MPQPDRASAAPGSPEARLFIGRRSRVGSGTPPRTEAWARDGAGWPETVGEPALRALWTAWFSVDPRAAVTTATAQALGALGGGSGDEPTWYALLRGREMLGEEGPVGVGAARWPSLLDVAHGVAQRYPGSPRLATLRARLDGGVPASRAALLVNPAYAPAQVALGQALLRQGRPQVARALLEQVREPERVQGAGVALARARVETGDPGKALIAAARESNAPGLCGIEPSIHDAIVARDLDEVRGLARLALGAVDAGVRSLLNAVAAGSAAARRALMARAGCVDVLRALSRLAQDAALPADARALAAALAA